MIAASTTSVSGCRNTRRSAVFCRANQLSPAAFLEWRFKQLKL
jgi:hypothetical protein